MYVYVGWMHSWMDPWRKRAFAVFFLFLLALSNSITLGICVCLLKLYSSAFLRLKQKNSF